MSMSKLIRLLSFVFVLLLFASSIAQSTNLPLGHWLYDFVERFKTKGYIEDLLCGTRPFSRQEMARAAAQIMDKVSEGAPISKIDRELLREIEAEFADELSRVGRQVAQPPRPHLYSWRSDSNLLVIDPLLKLGIVSRAGDIGSSPDRVFTRAAGATLRGTLAGDFGFYLNARETEHRGDGSFSSYRELNREHGLPVVLADKNSVSYDETDAYLTLPCKWFQMEFGKQFQSWGPGYWGNLTLSAYAPSFESLSIKASYGRWKFVWLAGVLRTDLPEYFYQAPYSDTLREVRKSKYLAAHRAEFAPHPRIVIGANEAVVYGERGIDPGYLIPIMFFWSEQHYIYGDDNATIGADITAYLRNDLKLYSEIFIDDLSLEHFDFSRPDNKWAILGGAYLVDPLGVSNSDFRVEYVRVEPYVYSHRIPINVYENHGYVLGHRIGPNSDGLFSEINYRFSKALVGTLSFQKLRHGRNITDESGDTTNVGGDIKFPIEHNSTGKKQFLDGILEKENTLAFRLSYRAFRDLFIVGEFRYSRINDQALGLSEKRTVAITASYNFYQ